MSSDIVCGKFRMVVRNSVECTNCGAVVSCTHKEAMLWETHDCDEGWFSIGGGAERIERCGSAEHYRDTAITQYVALLPRKFNPSGTQIFFPEQKVA